MLRIVVPARIGSTRLPDKMIQKIGGKMLVEHALDRVLSVSPVEQTWLATDSEVIRSIADGRCRAVLTPSNCRSGTDRCASVASIEGWADDDIVVNVQADMPFLRPDHLNSFLAAAARGGGWDVLTAYSENDLVEVGVDDFVRKTVLCHIGLYAYRCSALRRFAALPTSDGERLQRLEQLRAAENGFTFAYHALPEMPFEVNTPRDLAAAQWIAECLG